MRKRVYKRVDISKLSKDEKKAYRKRLAAVRKYTHAKREWQKLIKAGRIDPNFITLEKFRRVKAEGKPIESLEQHKQEVAHLPAPTTKRERIDLEKIRRLFNELENKKMDAQHIEEEIYAELGA